MILSLNKFCSTHEIHNCSSDRRQQHTTALSVPSDSLPPSGVVSLGPLIQSPARYLLLVGLDVEESSDYISLLPTM